MSGGIQVRRILKPRENENVMNVTTVPKRRNEDKSFARAHQIVTHNQSRRDYKGKNWDSMIGDTLSRISKVQRTISVFDKSYPSLANEEKPFIAEAQVRRTHTLGGWAELSSAYDNCDDETEDIRTALPQEDAIVLAMNEQRLSSFYGNNNHQPSYYSGYSSGLSFIRGD
jgi:hypothetical protein